MQSAIINLRPGKETASEKPLLAQRILNTVQDSFVTLSHDVQQL